MGPVMPASNGTILGQVYYPKASCDAAFEFETNSLPGQFVPVHIHPTQDEFILVQEGVLDLKLDGVWVKAKAGDLVRMPRRIPHRYFNNRTSPLARCFGFRRPENWKPYLKKPTGSVILLKW
jgi:quercetin dioxygenase-like cupin family protein